MLPIFPIIQEANLHIQKKLQDVAHEHDVKILLAVESGSRAWGFPSTDSDYDVRFIYARPKDSYLSIKDYRDVIETPLLHDEVLGVPLDFNGWDIRKALQLAMKSNPVLIEWLVSPVRYDCNVVAADRLLDFAKKTANIQAFHYHYDRLARNAWEQIQQNAEQVKLKLYCYALRPVLSSQWTLQYNQTPPMDMPSLCKGLINETALLEEIDRLIRLKATANEGDIFQRNVILDTHIASVLEHKAERHVEVMPHNGLIAEADHILREVLG